MYLAKDVFLNHVNCRIGSLESKMRLAAAVWAVNCRIGSLEMKVEIILWDGRVNCRIGSLEKRTSTR